MTQPLWTPSPERLSAHTLSVYAEHVAARYKVDFRYDYCALHQWSVEQPEAFWTSIIEFSQFLVEGAAAPALLDGDRLPGARWFPNLRLNYAENLLRHPPQDLAVIACNESGHRRAYSFGELRHDALANMSALQAAGADSGTTVAAILPNIYEAVPALLGATALGATWCSVSPDFGAAGMLDRLGQVAPAVLYAVRNYRHNGKDYDISEKLAAVIDALPSFKRVVVVDQYEFGAGLPPVHEKAVTLDEFLRSAPGPAPALQRFPFDHPLFILFTSGTTGAPKCIVHGAGGTLLQLAKEHALHCNVGPGSRVLFPTTLGWMMWNWLVTSLATGGTIVLFDGSPAHPTPTALFDVIEREQVTMVGLASAFIESVRKAAMDLRASHRFDAVDTIFAGGSVLSAEGFRFMSSSIMPGKPLYSCSGGTDIVSCFLATDPWSPIYAGELSAAALGMDMHVYDEEGRTVIGEKGELVCARPAPSMPRGFLNDADGARYRAAYFERFPGVWAHGDFAEQTRRGTFIIHGRSDAVLNPGGVRIGTAEIYRQVDRIPGILASVAVGQQTDDDVRVVLFVKLAAELVLDEPLENRIRQAIRDGASPRHVPKRIVQVPDMPMTRSGKISEAAVRELVNGRPVKNTAALLNAEALMHFKPPM